MIPEKKKKTVSSVRYVSTIRGSFYNKKIQNQYSELDTAAQPVTLTTRETEEADCKCAA